MHARSIPLLCLALAACGRSEEPAVDDAELLDTDAVGQELNKPSPGTRIVHWQVNSDWAEATGTYFTPSNVFRRAAQYELAPDLFALQECGRACACGDAKNHDQQTADCIARPPPESMPRQIEAATGLKYGIAVSVWANALAWRTPRFSKLDWFQWNATQADPSYGSCAKPNDKNGWEQMNIAVHLKDDRGTLDPGDDTTVVLASLHLGNVPSCTAKHLKYLDARVKADWPGASFIFVSGDWNMTVDTTSGSAALRKAELAPSCWWKQYMRGVDAGPSCGADFAGYLDAVAVKHPGGAPYAANKPICAQWTFINPGDFHSANDDRCDAARGLTRIDYTFVGGTQSTPTSILKATTDKGYFDLNGNGDVDSGEKYAGHRAIRTVVGY